MSSLVVLKNRAEDGQPLEVTFDVEKGMNFISYKKGGIEIIDQSTKPLFDERCAGLGAMIGPHFHHRTPDAIAPLKDLTLFPHIKALFAKGIKEPFSHGIGRYVPWKADYTRNTISAILTGDDNWKGISLKELEGQQFTMVYEAELTSKGLLINLSVSSEKSSVVGLHTYYAIRGANSSVQAEIQDVYNDHGTLKEIPFEWEMQNSTLHYNFDREMDFGFYPKGMPGKIILSTGNYKVHIQYKPQPDDHNLQNSWQLWHPLNKSFVCIEPLSAKIPSKPTLSSSRLGVLIQILNK